MRGNKVKINLATVLFAPGAEKHCLRSRYLHFDGPVALKKAEIYFCGSYGGCDIIFPAVCCLQSSTCLSLSPDTFYAVHSLARLLLFLHLC